MRINQSCAIMQPYFLPYIGYFQLINAVEKFVVYDNVQYTKRGWINRNRIMGNGQVRIVTVPLRSGSDYLDISNRFLSREFDRKRLLREFDACYMRTNCYSDIRPLLERIIMFDTDNLFDYIYHSLRLLLDYLEINTELYVSSTLAVDRSLKAENRVMATCKALGVQTYINAIGGIELYSYDQFMEHDLILKFLRARLSEYPQSGPDFVPSLSILDIMSHCSKDQVLEMIRSDYDLVDGHSVCLIKKVTYENRVINEKL